MAYDVLIKFILINVKKRNDENRINDVKCSQNSNTYHEQ